MLKYFFSVKAKSNLIPTKQKAQVSSKSKGYAVMQICLLVILQLAFIIGTAWSENLENLIRVV
jgi:hypothetical protein